MPERIQRLRRKGWRMPAGCIYVGRPTRWGNNWAVGTGQVVATGTMYGEGAGFFSLKDQRSYDLVLHDGLWVAEAVLLYAEDLEANLANPDPSYNELRTALLELRGHDLCCWCGLDQACHVDPLLLAANR